MRLNPRRACAARVNGSCSTISRSEHARYTRARIKRSQAGIRAHTHDLSEKSARKRMCIIIASAKSTAFDLEKPPGSKDWLRIFYM